MDPILLQSATRLASRIRSRELSSSEVVWTHIERIRAVNPRLNAVVVDRFDAAMEEARAADRAAQTQDPASLPPFHGVPCTIKEAFALEGMPNTAGLVARAGKAATKDAVTVTRLRQAGCIPLGVTNTSELCMWMESNNRVYGRTNNAYDEGRVAGGSSGGEGAIVGAGGVPFGLGSDVGGSIRMPAFFNGVFGHKPTGGMVPSTGQFPVAENDALKYLTTGPLTRRAEDLMPILKLLAGPDGEDTRCKAWTLGDPKDVSVKGLRVVVVRKNGIVPVEQELLDAQDRCATALAKRGARVVEATIDNLAGSIEMWSAMLDAAGGESFSSLMGEGEPIAAARELLRWALGRSPHTLPAIALALVEKVPKLLPERIDRLVAATRELRNDVVSMIGPGGVMLYPPYAKIAPKHNVPLVFTPIDWSYTAILNVLEVPATQVPLGLDARGLPLGLQIVGVHGEDHVTIAVANVVEELFGGWIPPARFADD